MFQNPDDEVIREILSSHRTIAVVGCSPKPYRDSHRIAAMLMGRGHTVIPVNPGHREILGVQCYPDLLSVPDKVEMVDIFRRSEYLPDIAEQAVAIGARIFWAQLGIFNEAAAERAKQAGMIVVMDRCPAIEYRRLGINQ
jgi:predicted CoA-binding protein